MIYSVHVVFIRTQTARYGRCPIDAEVPVFVTCSHVVLYSPSISAGARSMTHIIENLEKECTILPFRLDQKDNNPLQTTTIAAIVAVTVLHENGISAEDKLLEIIEKSGEAEILNSEDTFSEFGLVGDHHSTAANGAANDNHAALVLI